MKRKLTVKRFLLFTLVFTFILAMSFDANAQRRKSRSKAAAAKRAKAAAEKAQMKADIKKGAEDVAIQIKNLSKKTWLMENTRCVFSHQDPGMKVTRITERFRRFGFR